jgi:hypothetical protein
MKKALEDSRAFRAFWRRGGLSAKTKKWFKIK